jgi:alkylated DNA repair dioxygenase AlkB
VYLKNTIRLRCCFLQIEVVEKKKRKQTKMKRHCDDETTVQLEKRTKYENFQADGKDSGLNSILVDQSDEKAWILNDFLTLQEHDELWTHCLGLPWIRHTLYPNTPRQRQQARWSCSMGAEYRYSGAVHPKSDWTQPIEDIMKRVNDTFGTNFNACLLNKYDDGNQHISAHSDDERQLAPGGKVLGISLGAERTLELRHKTNLGTVVRCLLPPASCFMMEGKHFQRNWTHAIPKDKSTKPRISLTFRHMAK